ncbi:hypothetical protein D1871_07365 [Nakamurella silvestris]|nr:hypothetical protein D1871_07365 [Nakamurella silvestris]
MEQQPDPSFSWTSYTTGPPPEEVRPWETPTATDADDHDLAEIRRRVVEPIISAALTPDQYSSILVYRYAGDHDEIGVLVETVDGPFLHPLTGSDWCPGSAELTEMAHHLASAMEDWLPESSFGWGVECIVQPVVLD